MRRLQKSMKLGKFFHPKPRLVYPRHVHLTGMPPQLTVRTNSYNWSVTSICSCNLREWWSVYTKSLVLSPSHTSHLWSAALLACGTHVIWCFVLISLPSDRKKKRFFFMALGYLFSSLSIRSVWFFPCSPLKIFWANLINFSSYFHPMHLPPAPLPPPTPPQHFFPRYTFCLTPFVFRHILLVFFSSPPTFSLSTLYFPYLPPTLPLSPSFAHFPPHFFLSFILLLHQNSALPQRILQLYFDGTFFKIQDTSSFVRLLWDQYFLSVLYLFFLVSFLLFLCFGFLSPSSSLFFCSFSISLSSFCKNHRQHSKEIRSNVISRSYEKQMIIIFQCSVACPWTIIVIETESFYACLKSVPL